MNRSTYRNIKVYQPAAYICMVCKSTYLDKHGYGSLVMMSELYGRCSCASANTDLRVPVNEYQRLATS